MSDSSDNQKYKWTPESTSLLVSVWSDRQVQKQLEYTTKPQLIWESVARYMRKKGYNVTAKQCRSRMKQVLVCYREAKRAGTRGGVEQYYESIDNVLKNRRVRQFGDLGIDTVDSVANMKSPPKEMKTSKNLQMRYKYQDPVESHFRTEALSPIWINEHENEYPDSPESNETVVARPCNAFSPTRDVAIDTAQPSVNNIGNRANLQGSIPVVDCQPQIISRKSFPPMHYAHNEIPYQNTVQNVQNQIIQENMQQYLLQNRPWNRQQQSHMNNLRFQQMPNVQMNQDSNPIGPQLSNMRVQAVPHNSNIETLMHHQNLLQQNVDSNRAVPQEPRKIVFGHNLAATYKHPLRWSETKDNGSLSPDYSMDPAPNLNDAFCQTSMDSNQPGLNETYTRDQIVQIENNPILLNNETSVITNNATCNDDSLLLDYLLNSPTSSESGAKSRHCAVNTENVPNAPVRKKKAQKLEQLVLSAISSQSEVVNKILEAQTDMVSRFMELDRDRQNRLENRLDHLLNAVQANVIKQTPESEHEIPPPLTLTSLGPPPKPGVVPPKLDLVPPKPCRVPCTVANANIELINQNPIQTRPGVVSPITTPSKKPGTIWSKLGPVSQSPFLKAQERLGFRPIFNTGERMQSSAERRIVREVDKMPIDVIYETSKFLEMERRMEQEIENARLGTSIGQSLTARKRLFTQREPTLAMILTAKFLDEERKTCDRDAEFDYNARKSSEIPDADNLLAGQGESYNRLRRLDINSDCLIPCESSTPAKIANRNQDDDNECRGNRKQTIQQLAQLMMKSARWRDIAAQNQNQQKFNRHEQMPGTEGHFASNVIGSRVSQEPGVSEKFSTRPLGWNEDRLIEMERQKNRENNQMFTKPEYPIGFDMATLKKSTMDNEMMKDFNNRHRKDLGLENQVPDRKMNVRFMDDALAELQRMYALRSQEFANQPPFMTNNGQAVMAVGGNASNQGMIKRYVQDFKDNGESDNDEDFLDTTTTLHLPGRRGSLISNGTTSTEAASSSTKFGKPGNCVIN